MNGSVLAEGSCASDLKPPHLLAVSGAQRPDMSRRRWPTPPRPAAEPGKVRVLPSARTTFGADRRLGGRTRGVTLVRSLRPAWLECFFEIPRLPLPAFDNLEIGVSPC